MKKYTHLKAILAALSLTLILALNGCSTSQSIEMEESGASSTSIGAEEFDIQPESLRDTEKKKKKDKNKADNPDDDMERLN